MKKRILFTALLCLPLILISCDSLCRFQIIEVTEIQNWTGRDLQVSVCNSETEQVILSLPDENSIHEYNINVTESSEVRGGLSASCSGVSDKRSNYMVPLSQTGFAQVKNCFDQANQTNIIVELGQVCPAGTLEQTSPEACY